MLISIPEHDTPDFDDKLLIVFASFLHGLRAVETDEKDYRDFLCYMIGELFNEYQYVK